jgi:hypothetical protein
MTAHLFKLVAVVCGNMLVMRMIIKATVNLASNYSDDCVAPLAFWLPLSTPAV